MTDYADYGDRARRKSLRALYLDGELAVNIDAQTLLSSRFQVGTEITDEELHELLAASDANRAKEKALYLIAHRDHSKKELVDKIRRTASQEAAEKAADRMEEIGLIATGITPGGMPRSCFSGNISPENGWNMS